MGIKEKQIFTFVAFVLLVGGIVGGWYLFSGIMIDDCERIKNGIYDILEKENYCNVDNDCAIVRVLDCPFGCSNYVNKKYDMDILEQEYEKFYSCSDVGCEYGCVSSGPATCFLNKCVGKN